MTRLALTLLLAITASFLFACTSDDPIEIGRELGARHAERLMNDDIDLETIGREVEAARARFADAPEARQKLMRAYEEGIRPARAQLLALAMEEAGVEAGRALGEVLEGTGEGLGRAARGFMRELGVEPKGEDGTPEIDEEDLKELGRGLGKLIKAMEEGAEAVAEGVEEELAKP